MLAFDGVWHIGEVFSSRMNPGFLCTGQMAFWMYRHTMTRSWGPLLCPSSTTITSCCSMIIHGPMLQGSVLNSWKLKTSQFLHGQHTHRTCHPLSMFGMLWIGINDSVFPVPANIQQPRTSHWRGVDQHSTGHNQQPDQLYAKEMCCTEWGKWWSHQILTGFLNHIILFSVYSQQIQNYIFLELKCHFELVLILVLFWKSIDYFWKCYFFVWSGVCECV